MSEMIAAGDCDNEALIGTLESIEGAVEVKTENTIFVIKNAEANSEALGNMIKHLQDKKKAIDNSIGRTESFLFGNLEAMGISTLKAGIFTVKQINNPGSVNIVDESLVPAMYQTIIPASYKISKTDIAKHLKEGIIVPGAELVKSQRWCIK